MKKARRRNGLLVALGSVALAALAWFVVREVEGGDDPVAIEGATVERGPLRISVVERGNLKAAESVTLKCEIEGQTQVLYLIEEGTFVEPGELLCELDASDLKDERIEQEIKVQNRHAEYVKAEQSYQIQVSQNESDVARAERELEFARLDLKKYLEGDMPQELQKADEDILLRNEELTRARQDLEWSEKLAQKGFLEQTQLDADRLARTRSEVGLNQAKRAKQLLEEYEIPRNRKELEAEVEEKVRELERVKLQANARIADYEAELKTSKARLDLEAEDLAKIDRQLDKARIHAPVAGMVVYAVENRGRWGGGEPMQEGANVRERQEIITIPSAEGYVAVASLHESVLEKVVTGMPCLVSVDALPKRTFAGRVKFKAVLPDQQSFFANPDLRVYRTEIQITDRDADMRPGMSCSIEILVDELTDALTVPVQAVRLDAGAQVCFVSKAGTVEKRRVEVGPNNGKLVAIDSGLSEGEVVLLSPPPGTTLAPAAETQGTEGDENWQRSRAAAAAAPPITRGSRYREGAESVDGADGRAHERGSDHDFHEPGGGDDFAERARALAERDPAAAERMRQWAEDNPEAAQRMREAMADPEARREMMERWQQQAGAPADVPAGAPDADATAVAPANEPGERAGEPTLPADRVP